MVEDPIEVLGNARSELDPRQLPGASFRRSTYFVLTRPNRLPGRVKAMCLSPVPRSQGLRVTREPATESVGSGRVHQKLSTTPRRRSGTPFQLACATPAQARDLRDAARATSCRARWSKARSKSSATPGANSIRVICRVQASVDGDGAGQRLPLDPPGSDASRLCYTHPRFTGSSAPAAPHRASAGRRSPRSPAEARSRRAGSSSS